MLVLRYSSVLVVLAAHGFQRSAQHAVFWQYVDSKNHPECLAVAARWLQKFSNAFGVLGAREIKNPPVHGVLTAPGFLNSARACGVLATRGLRKSPSAHGVMAAFRFRKSPGAVGVLVILGF